MYRVTIRVAHKKKTWRYARHLIMENLCYSDVMLSSPRYVNNSRSLDVTCPILPKTKLTAPQKKQKNYSTHNTYAARPLALPICPDTTPTLPEKKNQGTIRNANSRAKFLPKGRAREKGGFDAHVCMYTSIC